MYKSTVPALNLFPPATRPWNGGGGRSDSSSSRGHGSHGSHGPLRFAGLSDYQRLQPEESEPLVDAPGKRGSRADCNDTRTCICTVMARILLISLFATLMGSSIYSTIMVRDVHADVLRVHEHLDADTARPRLNPTEAAPGHPNISNGVVVRPLRNQTASPNNRTRKHSP